MEETKDTILIVDDEMSIRESFNLILRDHYNVILVASGEAALKKSVDQKISLVYLDIRMPGMDGLETLKHLKSIDKNIEVIMVTAVNEVQKAVEAIKRGARDYIVKPFDVHKILNMTGEILKHKALRKEIKNLHLAGAGLLDKEELIGSTEKINSIRSAIEKISDKDFNLLVEGPIGTEKQTICKLIHYQSARSSKNIVIVDIPSNASELYLKNIFWGSGKGASVHQLEKKEGLLEKSSGGTLVIHNIENLNLNFQKELFTALKDKAITREGSSETIVFNVRILSTSNSNLKELVDKGLFNAELYGLISELIIEIPNLSARSMDIPLLANYFLEKFNQQHDNYIKGFTKEAMDILIAYKWPGNTEELKSLVEWLAITRQAEFIAVNDLPIDILLKSPAYLASEDDKNMTFDMAFYAFEKQYTEEILIKSNNDKVRAAKLLGLNLPALAAKLDYLGIKV